MNRFRLGILLGGWALVNGLFPAVNANAEGGQGHGNGGDGLVIQFTGTARNIAESLTLLEKAGAGCVGVFSTSFSDMVAASRVESLPIVFEEGGERDAWNIPGEKRILISRSRLTGMSDPKVYTNLVMHEYFGLLGVETTNETALSQACVSNFESHRLDLAKVVYSRSLISTTENDLASGKAFLRCISESGSEFRIRSNLRITSLRMQKEIPLIPDMVWRSTGPTVVTENYDLSTGRTSFHINKVESWSGMRFYSTELNLDSVDHLVWSGFFTTTAPGIRKTYFEAKANLPITCSVSY